MTLNTPEPAPVANDAPATWLRVIDDTIGRFLRVGARGAVQRLLMDMTTRHHDGVAKYGTPLQPNNGRDSLKDAYQEVLDFCVYVKNAELEGFDSEGLYEDGLDLALAVRVAIERRDGR